jgi:hypothetical protein
MPVVHRTRRRRRDAGRATRSVLATLVTRASRRFRSSFKLASPQFRQHAPGPSRPGACLGRALRLSSPCCLKGRWRSASVFPLVCPAETPTLARRWDLMLTRKPESTTLRSSSSRALQKLVELRVLAGSRRGGTAGRRPRRRRHRRTRTPRSGVRLSSRLVGAATTWCTIESNTAVHIGPATLDTRLLGNTPGMPAFRSQYGRSAAELAYTIST